MAYQELIKNFTKIRYFMREFYVYGFKTREQYNLKSLRSYDNEKRRIDDYLSDYMGFHQNNHGKNVFISIDSRNVDHNPLYKAFLSKSFTNNDITLHFILLDILYDPQIRLSIQQIIQKIDQEYLISFQEPLVLDESTIRKKIKEYIQLGILCSHKDGKQLLYSRMNTVNLAHFQDALDFFSEYALLGVIGYYLNHDSHSLFSFKHHYITHALDSEILYLLLIAIGQKREVILEYHQKNYLFVPLKIYVSTQNGRRYLLGYNYTLKSIKSCRLDHIIKVVIKSQCRNFQYYQEQLKELQKYMWGVALSKNNRQEHVEFILEIDPDEQYIYKRLMREKRIGMIQQVDDTHYRFTADIFDTHEIIPWIRTFIGRITYIDFSNKMIEEQFKNDLLKMYEIYGLKEVDNVIS